MLKSCYPSGVDSFRIGRVSLLKKNLESRIWNLGIKNEDMEAAISENKLRFFTDLKAWQECHSLVLIVYKVTKQWPKEEMYGLTSQIRRSAVSTTSNIAEGFGRRSYKEKANFYSISLGSLNELHDQLMIARDLSYLLKAEFAKIEEKLFLSERLVNGLITKCRSYK